MYFAEDSMQGMDMSMSAHTTTTPVAKETIGARVGNNIQHPSLAVPLITIAAIGLMLGVYWLLKRFTTWQFPTNKRG